VKTRDLRSAALERLENTSQENRAEVGRLESLPKWLNLMPMVLQWLWLGLKYRSITLPSAANPSITAGGLIGEGKSEYFRVMGAHARGHTADFAMLENQGPRSATRAEDLMCEAGLEYPLILKPDIGWCGFGVRLVQDRKELEAYLDQFPAGEIIMLQRFMTCEGEAGIYYVRHPDLDRGRVASILLRYFPRVVGDGWHTVAELIAAHSRVRRLTRDGHSEACCDPLYVPSPGEIVRVSITGSTRVGGLYRDGSALITSALESAVDAIAQDMPDLHVARFDVRFESLAALCSGTGFKIIEVNGVGSEAVHAWDPKYSLPEAYEIVFAKQRLLFSIGAVMRARGREPISFFEMADLYLRQSRLIRRYPRSN